MPEAKEIQLSRGMVALVDADDFDWLNEFKWSAGLLGPPGWEKPYAVRTTPRPQIRAGNPAAILMHRLIMGASSGEIVDHRFGNTLDNRRSQLRKCTRRQNAANSRRVVGRSGYRGVSASGNRWAACISVNNKTIHIGSYGCPIEAAHAYDEVAIQVNGEFAVLNFPERYAAVQVA